MRAKLKSVWVRKLIGKLGVPYNRRLGVRGSSHPLNYDADLSLPAAESNAFRNQSGLPALFSVPNRCSVEPVARPDSATGRTLHSKHRSSGRESAPSKTARKNNEPTHVGCYKLRLRGRRRESARAGCGCPPGRCLDGIRRRIGRWHDQWRGSAGDGCSNELLVFNC